MKYINNGNVVVRFSVSNCVLVLVSYMNMHLHMPLSLYENGLFIAKLFEIWLRY